MEVAGTEGCAAAMDAMEAKAPTGATSLMPSSPGVGNRIGPVAWVEGAAKASV